MLDSCPFLADHVLMALQDESGDILFAWRRLLYNANVANLIDVVFKASFLGETTEELKHSLLMTGLTRDTRDVLENLKYVG